MSHASAPEAVKLYSDLEVHGRPTNGTQFGISPPQPNGYETILTPNVQAEHPRISCGSSKWIFAGLAALVTAIVVGGAVGGGLGASLSSCQNEKSALSANLGSNTVTVTAASPSSCPGVAATLTTTSSGASATTLAVDYVPPAPSQIYNLSLDCTEGQVIQDNGKFQNNYVTYCGVDFSNHVVSSLDQLLLVDILGITAYTLEDCLQACSILNDYNEGFSRPSMMYCRSVLFGADIYSLITSVGANCWIKNGTPADISSLPQEPAGSILYLSAALATSVP